MNTDPTTIKEPRETKPTYFLIAYKNSWNVSSKTHVLTEEEFSVLREGLKVFRKYARGKRRRS